ncbi:MAG: AraC family transcriptional regulator [Yoonia sp.]|uniref:helix-turn-helix domain-containing protein n=1 Tax=Rhodobacterales TaxID=204455 RepID=UPI001FF59F18|nr:AraC family transcriptional regulator [Loktanella sp. F6476L]MCK0122753.1 AraC family transcriptional regulator [Loktanella sp. F6476L]UWQ99991.1 AraC family transcriptional regulator [Rhodobacteraceae bacterium S2214]UWR01306.1 AraC family transcriptional regulator [Rhodobacteraceae bacterium S2214]
MSIMVPKIELVDRTTRSIRYLEHGWPTDLCRWHAHEEYELHLVVATRGKAFVGDYIGDFEAGDLFLTGPNLPHNWITDKVWTEPVATRDMLVQFSHESFEKLAEGFPEFGEVRKMLTLAQSGVQFEGFNPTFARGHMESIRNNEGPERILAFIRFLVRLNEHAEKKVLSVSKLVQVQGGSKHARIGAVVDHIVANFKDDFSVGDAAEMAGMTQATFARNFTSVTGHKFVEFLTSVRVGQACSMLYASDATISDISFDAGFRNLANFNRHFLKMKGMTPSEYRDTARKDLSKPMETTS